MSVKVSYSSCKLFVSGMDMPCPLCGVLVRSGDDIHECSKENKPAKKQKAKR